MAMIGLGSDENMNYELAVLTIEAVKSKKELRASVRFRPSLQNTGMSMTMIVSIMTMALAQIPISTFSHIWVFVCQYGIMFVIIVIIIIIIIIYRKVKVSTLKHV